MCQASYLLYSRSKTRRLQFVGFNAGELNTIYDDEKTLRTPRERSLMPPIHPFPCNAVGLIKFDYMNVSCVACLLYASRGSDMMSFPSFHYQKFIYRRSQPLNQTVTFMDRVFREFVEAGYHDQSWQIFLFGVKYVVLVIDAWYVKKPLNRTDQKLIPMVTYEGVNFSCRFFCSL